MEFSMTENKKMMDCPHCLSEIPHGAHVCRGCQAEVKYGTPGFYILLGFLWPIFFTYWLICKLNESFHNIPNLFYLIFALVLVIIGWFISIILCERLFSNKIRFIRMVKK